MGSTVGLERPQLFTNLQLGVYVRLDNWVPIATFNARTLMMTASTSGDFDTVVVGIADRDPVWVSNGSEPTFHRPENPRAFWQDKWVTDVEPGVDAHSELENHGFYMTSAEPRVCA